MSASFEEASADLGADPWQTFRYVTLPNMRSALGAGGLLAFGLSFDEIIVTTFTIGAGEETLPIWIFTNLFRAQQRPVVNAVAVIVVLISIIPVYLAHRLTSEEGGVAGAAAAAARAATRPRRPRSRSGEASRVPQSAAAVGTDSAACSARAFGRCRRARRHPDAPRLDPATLEPVSERSCRRGRLVPHPSAALPANR